MTETREIELATMEATAKGTKGLPIGQRVRAVGFKVVTEEALRERFACKSIEEAQNNAIKAKLIADFCAEKGKTWEELEAEGFSHKEDSSDHEIHGWKTGKAPRSLFDMAAIMWDVAAPTKAEKKEEPAEERYMARYKVARKKRCEVSMCALDHYLEEIPNRVFDSLKVAKMCGLQRFAVAFPVLEDVPQKDPVLVAHLGDKLIEIDMWE